MSDIALSILAIIGAAAAAIAGVVMLVGIMQMTANRKHGYFHLIIPLMLLTTAALTAFSGRSIELNATALATEGMIKSPIAAWVQRFSTVAILLIAAERVISHLSQQKNLLGAAPLLALSFIGFWVGTEGAPMFLSAYPAISHDGFYTLLVGVSALMLSAEESDATLAAARTALLIYLLGGYLLIPVNPELVLDTSYTQGLVPGLPRLAGLSPHAVAQGMLAQMTLICLWAKPFSSRTLNILAWILGLATLVLAQSKTAWISFVVCAIAIHICQHGGRLKRSLGDPDRPHLGIAIAVVVMVLLSVFAVDTLFGSLGSKFGHFLDSDSGAQLTSLTGRDLIWSAAYEEWLRHPVFGYGPQFLDEAYRAAIGLPNATHGHNQYMDVLPRSGLVGAIPMTFYIIALLVLSVRHAVTSRGLTLALFLAIGLRAISEVPLTLGGYGAEFVSQLLLLAMMPAYNALAQRLSEAKQPVGKAFVRPSTQS